MTPYRHAMSRTSNII